jgi:hypothetical protein
MDDRRAHPRFEMREQGVLCLLDGESATREHQVFVRDVSLGGLGVLLDHRVPIDALVRVLVAGLSFLGRVAYCRTEGDKFAAGISMLASTDDLRKLLKTAQLPSQPMR